jgi:hypothetical protein
MRNYLKGATWKLQGCNLEVATLQLGSCYPATAKLHEDTL